MIEWNDRRRKILALALVLACGVSIGSMEVYLAYDAYQNVKPIAGSITGDGHVSKKPEEILTYNVSMSDSDRFQNQNLELEVHGMAGYVKYTYEGSLGLYAEGVQSTSPETIVRWFSHFIPESPTDEYPFDRTIVWKLEDAIPAGGFPMHPWILTRDTNIVYLNKLVTVTSP